MTSTTNDAIQCAELIVTGTNAGEEVKNPGQIIGDTMRGDIFLPTSPQTVNIAGTAHTVANTDNGKTLLFITSASVITLPAMSATTTGLTVTIVNNTAGDITINPNASDNVNFAGTTPADGVGLKQVAASAEGKDYITLSTLDSVVGWTVIGVRGTWVAAS